MPVCGGWAFLCSSVISQNKRPAPILVSSHQLTPLHHFPCTRRKQKTGPPLYKEVAGCAIGSARLFGAHVMRAGIVAIYFGFMFLFRSTITVDYCSVDAELSERICQVAISLLLRGHCLAWRISKNAAAC